MRDELVAVGEVVPNAELVQTTMNRVSKPWAVFVEALVARENLPTWDRICDDFVQEETQRGLLQCSASTSREDEEDVALTTKEKKKNKKGGTKQQDGQKKDLSTVKCFACQKMGHYARQCPNKKKK